MAGGSNVEEKCVRFFILVMSALCEWSLIVVLLINALLGYIATRFARFCRLPPPCILCSRLDYIIGGERRNLYRNIFCHEHKMDISSMVYCHGHRKLADFRNMCETCLLSSAATVTASTRPRPVFGLNLEDDDVPGDCKEEDLDEIPIVDGKLDLAALGARRCSCCSELVSFRRLLKARKLLKKSKIDGGITNRRVAQLRKRPEKTMDLPAAHAYDLLSHAGYSELKISSESESEGSFSGEEGDEDGGYSPAPRRVKDIKEASVTRSRHQKALPMEDMVPERLIHPNPETNNKPVKAASISKTEEVSWGNADVKKNKSEDSSERTIEQVPPQGSATDSVSSSADPVGDGRLSSSAGVSSKQSMSDPLQAIRGAVERSDSIKSTLSNKAIMQSPRFAELVAGKAQDDLKSMLSQKSLRMLDLPWNEVTSSPRYRQQTEDNTSIGLQNIAKKLINLERNNSGLESFDSNLAADIDAENSVDKLKQQLEQHMQSMSALYKELDEERNASAVAVNEAMAMINRLQEEKAGIQMEALQYLRMMEEQSEYDQEAIQKLNDLLTDREKELLDLEAELESYRRRYGEVIDEGSADASEAGPGQNPAMGVLLKARSMARVKSEKMDTMMIPEEGTDYAVKDVLLGFEEEKTQIAACLRRLEKKVCNVENRDEPKEGDESDGASTKEAENSPENGLFSAQGHFKENGSTTASLQTEIFKLNERLCALDADREFLGHAINVLRYGSDGVRLVQEIASHLNELRRSPMPANTVEGSESSSS